MTDQTEDPNRIDEAIKISNWLLRHRFAFAQIHHRRDEELISIIASKIRVGEYRDDVQEDGR